MDDEQGKRQMTQEVESLRDQMLVLLAQFPHTQEELRTFESDLLAAQFYTALDRLVKRIPQGKTPQKKPRRETPLAEWERQEILARYRRGYWSLRVLAEDNSLSLWKAPQVDHGQRDEQGRSDHLHGLSLPHPKGGAQDFVALHDSVETALECLHIELPSQMHGGRAGYCRQRSQAPTGQEARGLPE